MDQLQRQRQEQQQQQQQQHPSSLLGAPPQKDASNSSAATTTTTTTTEVGNGVDDDDDVDADERKVSAILHLFDNIVSPVRQASLIHSLLSRCHAASRDLLIRSATTAAATVAAASSGSVSAPSAPASALASASLPQPTPWTPQNSNTDYRGAPTETQPENTFPRQNENRAAARSTLPTRTFVPPTSSIGGMVTSDSIPNIGPQNAVASLPAKLSFRIMSYLDAKSLCRSAQVCSTWRVLADDDAVWHRMCEQHIDKKCAKCGWGLPLIRSGRAISPSRHRHTRVTVAQSDRSLSPTPSSSSSLSTTALAAGHKRRLSEAVALPETLNLSSRAATPQDAEIQTTDAGPTHKRHRSGSLGARPDYAPSTREPTPALEEEVTALVPVKQSWKRIYAERLLVERKWRRGQYDLRELEGHTGPVLCTHLDECLGLLVSGSADHTLKVWELDSGQCIGTLVGHTGEVTGVQLDGKKIVSGSMDGTVRIWNRLTLECIHVLQGHRGGVRALHIDGKVLATGSSDATIRIWDVSAGMSYTLRGHEGPVHRVSVFRRGGDQQPLPLLFSCSSDGTARLWDLNARSCLRVFSGHAGEVLDMQLSAPLARKQLAPSESRGAEPRLVTGSADGTVRVWDIETAECLHVLRAFNDGGGGGVFCVAADSLRVAAGSAGGGIGLWDVESGDPLYSVARPSIAGLEPMVAQLAVPSNGALPVPASALLSLSISDTKLVSGGADGVCRILSFAI